MFLSVIIFVLHEHHVDSDNFTGRNSLQALPETVIRFFP